VEFQLHLHRFISQSLLKLETMQEFSTAELLVDLEAFVRTAERPVHRRVDENDAQYNWRRITGFSYHLESEKNRSALHNFPPKFDPVYNSFMGLSETLETVQGSFL
jgi:hypothetical protein